MSQKKMGGGLVLLAGLAAMIFAIYVFIYGSGNNTNLLNVILYLCCGATFFFWGINLLIPNRHMERKTVHDTVDPQN